MDFENGDRFAPTAVKINNIRKAAIDVFIILMPMRGILFFMFLIPFQTLLT